MATHRTCDACGKEIIGGNNNKYSYRVHLDKLAQGIFDGSGFVDLDSNSTSGRDVEVDLCNGCYNKVVMPSVKMLYAIKQENGVALL